MNERAGVAKRLYFQAKTLSLGMMAAVFLYGAFAYFLVHEVKTGVPLPSRTLSLWVPSGMFISAVVGLWLMHGVRGRILNSVGSPGDVLTSSVSRPPQRLFVATAVMMAAAELPVLLGLVLVFLSGRPHIFLPFAALSLVGFCVAFPRKKQWEDWLGATF
ncbi:MAG: hypothetical protein KTQ49_08295 [Candidatus Omnitrophica bacterium]|nr:hypothetical protein [Candidatus Omnitrophota bacterium]